jgi:hypothetical protein
VEINISDSTLDNTAGGGDLLLVDAGSFLKTFGPAPLIQIDPGTVKVRDFFVEVSGIAALSGPLLRASDAILTSGANFVMVGKGAALLSTGTQPVIQVTNSALKAFTLLFLDGGTVKLGGGSFLSATKSQINLDFALIDSEFGGQLISPSDSPLVALNGGELISGGHLFLLGGDPGTGVSPVAARPPLQTGGSLLEATHGASITSAGNALRMDSALLAATAPIITLVGSTTKTTAMTTGGATMELFKSAVTSTGSVIALDRGLITVHNGPLINLSHGSTMVVTGDLLSLLNGSKINVLQSPLIQATGSGSLLEVSGALVRFGGLGGIKSS